MDFIISLFAGATNLLIILVLAPLLQGLIKKTKAYWQMRQGPGLFQSYRDLRKLWTKEEVISEHTSWIFLRTPEVVLASTIMAAFVVPNAFGWAPFSGYGDLFWFVASFALGRFFIALAGLDTAGTFGGMGTSRELFVSVLVEPTFLLGLLVLAFLTGSTSLQGIIWGLTNVSIASTPRLLAIIALIIVTIAEMGRIPVDNPDTHLELTMIHEGMVLEYSGRSLAFLNYAEQIKQFILLLLLVNIIWPTTTSNGFGLSAVLIFGQTLIKIALFGLIFATIESITVKVRLFRLPNFLISGTAAAVLSLITFWLTRGRI
ncbi:MAG: NADH-quinone oxidoreductase subunit H [Desulfitobacterium hafniense]|nr:NADH-quinone oxidoreductase subunit H [Desulfitobacterium hafniense]